MHKSYNKYNGATKIITNEIICNRLGCITHLKLLNHEANFKSISVYLYVSTFCVFDEYTISLTTHLNQETLICTFNCKCKNTFMLEP